MYCKKCGAEISENAQFCPVCGAPVNDSIESTKQTSRKSRLVAAILCWFFGCFGVHKFYVGRVGAGIAMLLTLGGLGIWAFVDFIIILCGNYKDKDGKVLLTWLDQ
ncbi:MAG: NINE protein [Bacteroidales bacterium]|nr:NINE protein [Bacteroidales bacterium]